MSAEDHCEFLRAEIKFLRAEIDRIKSKNEFLKKENYELKSHMEGLSDGFHEVVAGLKEELIQTTNDLNAQIRENLGFVNRLAYAHKRLKEERAKDHLLCNELEDLKNCLTQSKMEQKG